MGYFPSEAFSTPMSQEDGFLAGPWRTPLQMLSEQSYDQHASIHDDATALKLGFKGGTIEGPTHFSQFAPLGEAVFGQDWFVRGCLSVHYRSPVYEGDKVRALMDMPDVSGVATVRMTKADGTEVLSGTASLQGHGTTALSERLLTLPPLVKPVLLHGISVGQKSGRMPAVMGHDQPMGALYPFSLSDKLKRITEPSAWYSDASPFGGAIIPMEMMSVLLGYQGHAEFSARGPSVGLFADQEICLHQGPLFVGEAFEIEREVIALSGSRRTESVWIQTRAFRPGASTPCVRMLLNVATLKESYSRYDTDHAAMYG
jgi:hypothetical protein